MCHFINLVLPAQADVSVLRKIMERHGKTLRPSIEPRVDRALPPGDRAHLTTGVCDCGTGLASRKPERAGRDEDRGVSRRRRAGWSEARIRRWAEQRGSALAGRTAAKAKSREREVEAWLAIVSELLGDGVRHVGLVVHWATDDIGRGPVLSRKALNAQTLSGLQENVLYTFT